MCNYSLAPPPSLGFYFEGHKCSVPREAPALPPPPSISIQPLFGQNSVLAQRMCPRLCQQSMEDWAPRTALCLDEPGATQLSKAQMLQRLPQVFADLWKL